MSFVSIIANTKFLTVMTDGRATEEDDTISNENINKSILVNDNFFIAFTGDEDGIYPFIEESGMQKPYSDYKKFAQDTKFKLMSSSLRKYKMNFAMGGKNCRNEFEFFSFGTYKHNFDHYKATQSR